MQIMYERLSGYDYRCEVESQVTKCSFGSYKELCESDTRLQLFTDSHNDEGNG